MALIHISGPSGEPVTSADAALRTACKLDGTEFDSYLDTVVLPSLRRRFEAETGRALGTQVKELVIDQFPYGEIDLNMVDVQSISSLKYIDTNGVQQTLSNTLYSLDNESTPNWLSPAYDTEWPDTLDTINAVRVRFSVGISTIPADIKAWIIAHAANELAPASEKRDMQFIDGVLWNYRVRLVVA